MDRADAAAMLSEGRCPLDDARLVSCNRGDRGPHGTCPECGNCFLMRDSDFVHRVHGVPAFIAAERGREVAQRIAERTP